MTITLPLALVIALAKQVAPDVAPDTLATFACQESGNRPCNAVDIYAIHDNTDAQTYHPESAEDATALATRLILRDGHSVDLGALQINFRGPVRLGLQIAEAFNPRRNIAVGGAILADAWKACQGRYDTDKDRLTCAAALYNAGKESGAGKAYASRLWQVAATVVPSISRIISSDFPIAAPGITAPAGARLSTSPAAPEPAPVFVGPAKVGRTVIYNGKGNE